MLGKEGSRQGWSVEGTLIPGDDGAVTLQAGFKDRVGQYTIQFSAQTPDPQSIHIGGSEYETVDQLYMTLAEIIWSVEGNSVRRLVSVTNGLSVSGTGQSVNVKIYDWSLPSAYPGAQTNYKVACQVTPGTRATNGAIPSLDYDPDNRGVKNVQPIDATEVHYFYIPINAGINSVYLSVGLDMGGTDDTLVANKQLMIWDYTHIWFAGGSDNILREFEADSYNRWIPVPAGAKYIAFRALTGLSYALLVNASWGIDG